MAIKDIVNVKKNTSMVTVTSVVVGLAVFGGLMMLVRRAPENAVTAPIKKAASFVQ